MSVQIALVISTVGRAAELDALFTSLREQTNPPVEVVVADQSGSNEIAAVVQRWEGVLPVHRIASRGGAAAGRSDGLAALTSGWQAVGFPDDDVTYPPTTLAAVGDALERGLDGVTGRLIDSDGNDRRLSFDAIGQDLTTRNVWTHAIEATTFLSRALLDEVGVFDRELGVGTFTPWQSAEGTDLLLRALRAGRRVVFDPAVTVVDNPADAGPPPLSKVRAYARGTGRVMRRHYGPAGQLRSVIRPLAGAVIAATRGRRAEAARHLQAAIGRAEGVIGRTTKLLEPGTWRAS